MSLGNDEVASVVLVFVHTRYVPIYLIKLLFDFGM
jgi:hypothetical protein